MLEFAHGLIEGIGVVALCGGVWKVARLTTIVEDLRDNHLKHILAELVRLDSRVDRLFEQRP